MTPPALRATSPFEWGGAFGGAREALFPIQMGKWPRVSAVDGVMGFVLQPMTPPSRWERDTSPQ